MEKELKVKGMHCKSCEVLLTDVLSEIKGASNVAVNHSKGVVRFSCDSENVLSEIKKAIEAEGYSVA